MFYLNNNATTLQSEESKKGLINWLNVCSNPSNNESAQKFIKESKDYIKDKCNAKDYTLIYTSGATESNNFICKVLSDAYYKKFNNIPHYIISSVEHSSLIKCCEYLVYYNRITLSIIKPNIYGIIEIKDILKNVNKNTALVCIMYANNETGSINDIYNIKSKLRSDIIFHCDAVQGFGKYIMKLGEIDSVAFSFHKMYGPVGIGGLFIKNDVIKNYNIKGLINGTQQEGLRGGTESTALITGAYLAFIYNFENRMAKNEYLLKLKLKFLTMLKEYLPIVYYHNYNSVKNHPFLLILFGSPDVENMLPNTILLSIVCNNFCNVLFKETLEKYGVLISTSSACSGNSSHVVNSLTDDEKIKSGVIRVSFGDNNKLKDIPQIIKIIITCIGFQLPLIYEKFKIPKWVIKKKVRFEC